MSIDPILTQTEGYNVSKKYKPVPTQDVIEAFSKYGFELRSIEAAGTRNPEKAFKQKHMVIMSSDMRMIPGMKSEVVIYNSYDGSQSLRVYVGSFRFVCSNSMIVGNNLIKPLIVKHVGDSLEEKLNGFIDEYEDLYYKQKEWIEHMQERKMTLDEAYYLAERALNDRHYDKRIEIDVVDPLELLVAKRKEDRGDNAWLKYNIIQENIINGYFHKYDAEGSIRKAKIITNVDEIVRLNVTLSDIFDETLEVV